MRRLSSFVLFVFALLWSATSAYALSITTATLPAPVIYNQYAQQIYTSGGTGAVTFAITSGALPTGISLNSSTGAFSGSTSLVGTFSFDVTASDSGTSTTDTKSYSFTIQPAVVITTNTVATPVIGVFYSQTIATTGGTAPVTFYSVGGPLPTGLALNQNTGVISGTPSAAGTFNFSILAGDANSLTSQKFYSVTIAAVPAVTGVSPTWGASVGGTSVVITGSGFTGANAVRFGATSASFVVNSDTQITATSPPGYDGTLDITVAVAAGGTSATSAASQFTYVSPPEIPVIVTPANGATLNTTLPVFSGSAGLTGANKTITIYVDGVSIGTVLADASSNWSKTAPTALSEGPHTVYATSTNAQGLVSYPSATNSFTVDTLPPPAPVILSPANGATIASATPSYSGTSEANATVTVLVDGSPVGTTTANAGGSWSFAQPTTLSEGVHSVRARATDYAGNTGSDSATRAFTVDTIPPTAPNVTEPANGATTGSTTPRIAGGGPAFTTIRVYVDGAQVASTTSDALGGWAVVVMSSLSYGAHTVHAVAIDPAGNTSSSSATNTFTVQALPSVTALSPSQGPASGGTTVTVTGTGFSGATSVSFGGASATGFTVNSATQITATAPTGSGTVNVTVTTAAGASATGSGNQFTYIDAPTVSAVSPAMAPRAAERR